jgi:hypothetical protein
VVDFENALTAADHADEIGDAATLRAMLESAVMLYRGDLLPACYGVVSAFRERLRGPLLRPSDAGYDASNAIWNGMILVNRITDHRPLTTDH